MAEGKKPFNKILLYMLIGLMILTGSMNTIFNKILQKLYGLKIIFEQHHWIITFGMFLGELVSIFFYMYVLYKRKKAKLENGHEALLEGNKEEIGPINPAEDGETNQEEANKENNEQIKSPAPASTEEKKPPIPNNFIFSITAGCDLLATTINTFGLTYLTTSMYQMMRGMELFFVCLWSRIFLKNPIYRHAYLGIGSLIFGLCLVGLNSMIYKDDNKEVAKNPIVGIILMCTSQIFSSTQYVFQEKFIKQYDVHPFQLVGFEGLWGSIMYAILLTIFQFVDCTSWSHQFEEGICFSHNITHYNSTGGFKYNETVSYIEDTRFAFKQMGDNIALLIVYIFYIISIALYNIVGINLTKLVSSTARAVVDTVRTVFIWLFFLIFSPVEGTKEIFYSLQLVGFIFSVVGTLIYYEILVIPLWGLDYYTRDNIDKREKEGEESNKPNDSEKLSLSNDGKENKGEDNPTSE